MESVNDSTQVGGPAAATRTQPQRTQPQRVRRGHGLRRGAVHRASLRPARDAGRRRRGARSFRTRHRVRAPAAHRPSADAHAGQPGLRPAGGLAAVHAGLAADPARRDLQPDAGDVAAAVPGPAGPAHRGDREPGHARRRRGRLHRAGAQPAPDADVYRAGPPGPAALHRGRQGPARAASARRGTRAARAGRHAGLHSHHHHRPGLAARAPRGDPQARLRRRRRRTGGRRALLRGGRARRAGLAGHLHVRAAGADDRRRRGPHRARAQAHRQRNSRDHRRRGPGRAEASPAPLR